MCFCIHTHTHSPLGNKALSTVGIKKGHSILEWYVQSCQSTSVKQWEISLEKRKISERFKDPIEIHTVNCHSPQRPLKLRQWMNTVSLTGLMLTSLAPLSIFRQPLLSAAEPMGPSEAPGEAGWRFSQGLVNSWLVCKLRCSFNQIPSVLEKKKADFKFTLGFKIYYVFQLSSLHTWNSLPLITFSQHSSTSGGLTSKIALLQLVPPEIRLLLLLLSSTLYFQLPSDSVHSHTPPLTFQLPMALTHVFIFLISLFKVYVKALYWAPRELSSISGFSPFSMTLKGRALFFFPSD